MKIGIKENRKTLGLSSVGYGFTLIELLVSVAILTVITTVVLVNQNRFSGSILLGSLAYDVALSIRQAQVFGLSVREFGIGSGTFTKGYGIHFDTTSNNSYILFADINGNRMYDGPSELVELFSIQRGNVIAQFCGRLSSGVEKCSDTGDITRLDLIFERPNPDTIIKSEIVADTYEVAKIVVRSPQGTVRSIFTAVTGQISVQQEAKVTQGIAPYSQGYYQGSYYSQGTYYSQGSYYSQGYYQGSYGGGKGGGDGGGGK